MTVKEIALSVNKTERSVQRWVKKTSDKMSSIGDKMSSIGDKMSSSTSTNPADYTLEETILIIEKGLGKNAADIFRMSAGQNTDTKNLYVTKNDLAEFGKSIVSEMFKHLVPLLQSNNNQKQIGFEQDYYSIMGYCNLKSIKLDFSEAIKYGKEARKISDDIEKEIRKIPDERFGKVNSYHIDVLKKVFEV